MDGGSSLSIRAQSAPLSRAGSSHWSEEEAGGMGACFLRFDWFIYVWSRLPSGPTSNRGCREVWKPPRENLQTTVVKSI